MSPWERFGPPPLGYMLAVENMPLTEAERAERWMRNVVWWTPAPPVDPGDVVPELVEAAIEYAREVHAVLAFCRGDWSSERYAKE